MPPVAAAPLPAGEEPPAQLLPTAEPGAVRGASSRFGRELKAALDAKDPEPERQPRALSTPIDPAAPRSPVRFLETRYEYQGNGLASLYMHIQNDGRRPVAALAVRVTYYRGSEPLIRNASCRGNADIAPGKSAWLLCDGRFAAGATDYEIELSDFQLR